MVIYGRNSVKEALRSNKTVEKLYILKGMEDPAMANIYKYTKNNKNLVISYVEKKVLDKMADRGNHQGVVAIVTDYEYASVEDIGKTYNAESKKNVNEFFHIGDSFYIFSHRKNRTFIGIFLQNCIF